MVISINHLDGSCLHTVNADGKDLYHGKRVGTLFDFKELRQSQLKIREKEFQALITETFEKNSLLEKALFPEWVKLDKDRVIACGHSFGGITALSTASIDTRIKATLSMDPWMFPVTEQVDNGTLKLKVPVCTVNSSEFKRIALYDNNEYTTKMIENAETEHKDGYILDKVYH